MRNPFTICLTHDVDRVQKTYQYVTHSIKKRRPTGLRSLVSGENPYWNFERIAEIESSRGVRSTWFFLHETVKFSPFRPNRWKLALGRYSLRDPRIRNVIRELDSGGWEIGLHGSYESYRNADLLKAEKALLEEVLGNPVVGIRQHYLNLDVPETWMLHREAGFAYDASFGYRRGIGWKSDRLQPFRDSASGMQVLPLAVMECNLFTEAAGDPDRAWKLALEIIDQAERRGAVLTILWHPHVFSDVDFPGYTTVYEKIIDEGKRRGATFVLGREAIAPELAIAV